MDKTAIRNFAIEARKILMKSAITEAGFYGITKDGCKDPVQKGNDFEVYETVAGTENRIFGDDIMRRANLVQAIKTLGFEQVIEETAYTWFNRIIAIRFMEVNNYLPTRVRVLSSETGSGTPDIITQADTVELNLTSDELEKIQTAKRENRYDDAFRMLFIKQCNELNAILPGLFEKTDDYMELLLKITYTGDGVIRMLVDSIPEDNFNVETEGQVEIIGWMYQYYNTELKDDTFAKLKKNVKITKERIPAATQLFTPDWIVRYMVENSLGRVWIEHLRAVNSSVDEKAKAEEFGWKYYLPEAEQEDDVQTQLVEIRKSYKDLTPQDITCIDPCMGSGHILVYMFDVLMDIYRSEGFSEREAVFDILEKNIRGLDIDRRAYQLSYFALMMKARGYNRIFFRGHEDIDGNRVQAVPRVYAIEESNSIDREQLKYFGAGLDELSKNNAINQMNGLLDSMRNAKEYGSILNLENYDWKLLHDFLEKMEEETQGSLFGYIAYKSKDALQKLVSIGECVSTKYDAVVTNPPYMGSRGYSSALSKYIQDYYAKAKQDLFAVFIYKVMNLTKKNGFSAMITMHSFMFLAAFEKMRADFLENNIISLVHLGIKAFDEIGNDVVQTATYVFRNKNIPSYNSTFSRLVDCKDQVLKKQEFLKGNHNVISRVSDFYRIPGCPIAYWVSESFISNFENNKPLDKEITISALNKTGDNEKYLRMWWEVDHHKIGDKWRFYSKGGNFRRYYGNIQDVIDWSDEARYFYKTNKTSNLLNEAFWYREGITYSAVTSRGTGFRYLPQGCVFDMGGPAIFVNDSHLLGVLALLNSSVATYYFSVMNPSINLQTKDIKSLPVILDCSDEIEKLAKENMELAKYDWNYNENSSDFLMSELSVGSIKENYEREKDSITEAAKKFEENLKRINEIFADNYKLDIKELPAIEDRDIAVNIPTELVWIKRLIAYSVGCMFGRYSLESKGLLIAGKMTEARESSSKFKYDIDNIIPICDEEYFDDDIVARFYEFIKVVFGENDFAQNITYIATVLGGKGTDREIIRNYFMNEFYADHCSLYSAGLGGKRPIYWLFESGSENAFKCLVYLHRYTPDTVGLIRSDYLTKIQGMIENALKNAEYAINTSSSAVDRAQATKKRDKYIKQLAEIRAYYPALSHIALQRIELDLDDGVKANYAKFQGIEVSVEGEKKQKIDLLAKI